MQRAALNFARVGPICEVAFLCVLVALVLATTPTTFPAIGGSSLSLSSSKSAEPPGLLTAPLSIGRLAKITVTRAAGERLIFTRDGNSSIPALSSQSGPLTSQSAWTLEHEGREPKPPSYANPAALRTFIERLNSTTLRLQPELEELDPRFGLTTPSVTIELASESGFVRRLVVGTKNDYLARYYAAIEPGSGEGSSGVALLDAALVEIALAPVEEFRETVASPSSSTPMLQVETLE